jgi:hypothetical protein
MDYDRIGHHGLYVKPMQKRKVTTLSAVMTTIALVQKSSVIVSMGSCLSFFTRLIMMDRMWMVR